jgi:hypothetical protein
MIRLLLALTESVNSQIVDKRPADCFPNHCFCEAVGATFIRQPIDSITNIAYVIAGVIIILFTKKLLANNRPQIRNSLSTKLLYIYGLAHIAVGVGSFLYHSTFTFFGEQMDDDSMYLVASFILLFSIADRKVFSTRNFLKNYLILNIILELLILKFPVVRGLVFATLIIAATVSEISKSRAKNRATKYDSSFYLVSLAIFTLAYAFWILDYTRIWCHPESLYQGHAIWHVLTALAGVVMVKHMIAVGRPDLPMTLEFEL